MDMWTFVLIVSAGGVKRRKEKIVLQVGPGRADPARAHRASGLNNSGRASTNCIRAELNRAHVLKCRPSTALNYAGLASGRAGPDPARKSWTMNQLHASKSWRPSNSSVLQLLRDSTFKQGSMQSWRTTNGQEAP